MSILKSASKIVFLTITFTAAIAYLYGVFTNKITLETEHFMTLAGTAFGYYFGVKGRPADSHDIVKTKVDL